MNLAFGGRKTEAGIQCTHWVAELGSRVLGARKVYSLEQT